MSVERLSNPNGLYAAGLVAGLLVALVAQFGADSLADASQLWHWIQHGLLFAGGLVSGACLLNLYRAGQRPA